ncbi:hypothetical protein [Salinisphaera hydrothermalis]|uniref:Uncharacterized protein n=1 Tax=Salinisphaera hydrothermalis (strain C41B8) TaxID=1304275 RepID=A0A084IIR6_SALHC|nr:hypothetical protein [Salinisphaera hydrothermalis]KEZ76600.1 hypothetical protein C41B8_14330 [Salinisphaera hydrothermalis C41B8]
MATIKAATGSLREDSGVKEALRAVASREYHSIANRAKVRVLEDDAHKDIAMPAHDERPGMKDKT